MKYLNTFLLCTILCFVTQTSFGQNVNRIQRGQRGYTPPQNYNIPNNTEVARDSENIVDQQMPFYTEALNLDAFEQEIMGSMLKEYYDKKEVLRIDYAMSFTDKQDQYLKMDDALYEKLQTILSEEKVTEFKKIQIVEVTSKKKRKNKRKKKKKNKKNKDDKGTL